MNRRERLEMSRCERCGRVTKGDGELFTLPEEWGEPFVDKGAFCDDCVKRFAPTNWLTWLLMHGYLEAKTQVEKEQDMGAHDIATAMSESRVSFKELSWGCSEADQAPHTGSGHRGDEGEEED